MTTSSISQNNPHSFDYGNATVEEFKTRLKSMTLEELVAAREGLKAPLLGPNGALHLQQHSSEIERHYLSLKRTINKAISNKRKHDDSNDRFAKQARQQMKQTPSTPKIEPIQETSNETEIRVMQTTTTITTTTLVAPPSALLAAQSMLSLTGEASARSLNAYMGPRSVVLINGES